MRLVMNLRKPAKLRVTVLSPPFSASIRTPERLISGHSHLLNIFFCNPPRTSFSTHLHSICEMNCSLYVY